jgi:hypothetical protein
VKSFGKEVKMSRKKREKEINVFEKEKNTKKER